MVAPASPGMPPVDGRALAEWLDAAYGLRLTELVPIEGGLDAAASVWQGADAQGGLWCVKVNARDVRFGLRLSEAAAAASVPGIVAPVPTLSGEGWACRPGLMVSVSPWVVGLDGVDGGADSVPWQALGCTLRGLHDLAVPSELPDGRRGIRRRGRSLRRLLSQVDGLLAEHQPGLGIEREREVEHGRERGSVPHRDVHLAEAARLWAAERPRLTALAEAERRGKKQRIPTIRVPVHGDPHVGNVVMDGANCPWLIDFDDATVAPREVDLMLVELGVITSAPASSEHRQAFRLGYGTDVPIDEDRITRFACVRAIEDVTAAAHQLVGLPVASRAAALRGLRELFGPEALIAQTERRLDEVAAHPEPSPVPPQHTMKRTTR